MRNICNNVIVRWRDQNVLKLSPKPLTKSNGHTFTWANFNCNMISIPYFRMNMKMTHFRKYFEPKKTNSSGTNEQLCLLQSKGRYSDKYCVHWEEKNFVRPNAKTIFKPLCEIFNFSTVKILVDFPKILLIFWIFRNSLNFFQFDLV